MIKKSLLTLIIILSLINHVFAAATDKLLNSLQKNIDTTSSVDPKTREFTKKILTRFSTNSVFVEAVKSQNARKLTIQHIKQTDKEWIDAEEELPIHRELMNNKASQEIRKLISENPSVVEAFLMDNQGANVGQNDLTSDYWQGDEAKWQNAFNQGKGGLYVGKQKFDKSANQFLQQISIPIIDSDGSVVGAFCIGIDASRL